jgi:hypothetical protein
MTTAKQIHDLIAEYLKNKNLDAFSTAFAEVFYDIEQTGDAPTIELAYSVESALASATAGVCAEASLYESLKALSPSLSFKFYLPEVTTTQAVDYFTKWAAVAVGTGTVVTVDISPSAGFGSKAAVPDTHQTSTDLPQWQQVRQAV